MNDSDRITCSDSDVEAMMKQARVERARAFTGIFSSLWGSQSNKKTNRTP